MLIQNGDNSKLTNGTNSSSISSHSSNVANSSETSTSIASSSVSSNDENNLEERFTNSLALKCKLCTSNNLASVQFIIDNNNNNKNSLFYQNFNKSNAENMNNSAVSSYQNNENNYNILNQLQSSSVVDVLKHLSLDQDDFNMFQCPLVSNSLADNNSRTSGFSNLLNNELGKFLI